MLNNVKDYVTDEEKPWARYDLALMDVRGLGGETNQRRGCKQIRIASRKVAQAKDDFEQRCR